MKNHLLSASMALLLFGTPASADRLSIYSDAALTQYTIDDSVPRVVTLYVAGYLFESSGVRFSVRPGPGFTGVWLSDTSAFYPYGSSPTDIAIGFGRCVTSRSVLILTMSYQMFGTSSPCSELRAAPPDGFLYAIGTQCGADEVIIWPLDKLYANCPNPPIPPVATESSTWGKVKSLYRD
jgi:hypothetical protein